MFDAWVKREGETVQICLEVDFPADAGAWIFKFNRREGSVAEAALFVDFFQRKCKKQLETIRRKAYQQGWRDAKAKRKKETWFDSCW